MKPMSEIDFKELKIVVKELNDSGLIAKKIKLVGLKTEDLIKNFTEVIESLDEEVDIPQSIANFYNDLYADEVTEDGDDIEDPETEDEVIEDEIEEEVTEPEDDDDPLESKSKSLVKVEVEKKPKAEKPKAEKSPKKDPVIKEKKELKPKLGVKKRASVNPKLSLIKKVTNILDFATSKDGRYKQTTYFPLDCETVRILETNVGLYPTEIVSMMKQDKSVAKKIEKFSAQILIREINKIKSAYSYIVGAIKEEKTDSKFRHIITGLLSGKDIPSEMAHHSTVKVARRALLAYLDVTRVDYSVMKDVRKDLVKKVSEKKEKPEKITPKTEGKAAVELKPKKPSKK